MEKIGDLMLIDLVTQLEGYTAEFWEQMAGVGRQYLYGFLYSVTDF